MTVPLGFVAGCEAGCEEATAVAGPAVGLVLDDAIAEVCAGSQSLVGERSQSLARGTMA